MLFHGSPISAVTCIAMASQIRRNPGDEISVTIAGQINLQSLEMAAIFANVAHELL